jgi:exodeoxyribonuclease VII large subunit
LEGSSPLAKLKKGYGLVCGEDGKPIQSVHGLRKDDILVVSLLDGDIISRVDTIKEIKRDMGEDLD